MQKYMAGVVVFGLFPVFYCIAHYMSDVREYIRLDEDIELEDAENIIVWQVRRTKTNLYCLLKSTSGFRISPTDCSGMALHL